MIIFYIFNDILCFKSCLGLAPTKYGSRNQEWLFGKTGKDGFIYRAWMQNQGIPRKN